MALAHPFALVVFLLVLFATVTQPTPPVSRKRKRDEDDHSPLLLYCSRCHCTLSEDSFHRDRSKSTGRSTLCRQCHWRRGETLQGALKTILQSAKVKSKERLGKGRPAAGICTLTLQQLILRYEQQQGMCYWFPTKRMSFTPHSDWKMSLDRLDPSLGYTFENCRLVALEFNVSRTWSWEKIQRMREARSTPFVFDALGMWYAVHDEGKRLKCPHVNPERYSSGACKICLLAAMRLRNRGELVPSGRVPCLHGKDKERYANGRCKQCAKMRSLLIPTHRQFVRSMLASTRSNSKKKGRAAPEHKTVSHLAAQAIFKMDGVR